MPKNKKARHILPREEWPYEVPVNWIWTKLEDVTTIVGGGTPSTKVKEYYENGDIAWISPADLSDYHEKYISHGKKMITRLGLEKSSARLLPQYTVCLSTRAPIGYVAIAANELCTNQGFKSFTPSKNYVPDYLYWFLKGNKKTLEENASGTTFLELSAKKAGQITFPLPPFPEQHRIVTRIESLFAKLDAAEERIKTALEKSDRLRTSVLHLAFTGELTKKWREEYGVGIESWKKCLLLDILKGKPRNGYSPKAVDYPTACKSMTLSATTSGVFRSEHYKYIDETIPEDSYLWLKPGDILIQRANSLEKVGTSAIYDGNEHEFIYPDLMMKLEIIPQYCSKYVAYYLKQESVMSYFRHHAVGTAGNMPKINQTTVANVPVCVPSLPEQQEIVRILDTVFDSRKRVKEIAEQNLSRIARMKKSLLSLAFRGQLGTNNPAEESMESVLLASS